MYANLRNGTCKMGIQTASQLRTMRLHRANCDLDGAVQTLLERPTGWVIDCKSCLAGALQYPMYNLQANAKVFQLVHRYFKPTPCGDLKMTDVLGSESLNIQDMAGVFIINSIIVVLTFVIYIAYSRNVHTHKKEKNETQNETQSNSKQDGSQSHSVAHSMKKRRRRKRKKHTHHSTNDDSHATGLYLDEQLADFLLREFFQALATGKLMPSQLSATHGVHSEYSISANSLLPTTDATDSRLDVHTVDSRDLCQPTLGEQNSIQVVASEAHDFLQLTNDQDRFPCSNFRRLVATGPGALSDDEPNGGVGMRV